jgi:SET domain-containing protein
MEQINTFVKPSPIHGLGLFAKVEIKKGDQIIHGGSDFSYIDEWIAYAKKWKEASFAHNNGYCMVNHAEEPNTVRDKDFHIIASKDIRPERK